jgi:hypothetical protein
MKEDAIAEIKKAAVRRLLAIFAANEYILCKAIM